MNRNLQGEKLHGHLAWRRLWKRWLVGQLVDNGHLVQDVLRLIDALSRAVTLVYRLLPVNTGPGVHQDHDRVLRLDDTLATITKYVVAHCYLTIMMTYPGYDPVTLSCSPVEVRSHANSARPQHGQWYLLYRNALGGRAVRMINDKHAWSLEDLLEWLEQENMIQKKQASHALSFADSDASEQFESFERFSYQWTQNDEEEDEKLIEKKLASVSLHEPVERQQCSEPRLLDKCENFEALGRFSFLWPQRRGDNSCSNNNNDADEKKECSPEPNATSRPAAIETVPHSSG